MVLYGYDEQLIENKIVETNTLSIRIDFKYKQIRCYKHFGHHASDIKEDFKNNDSLKFKLQQEGDQTYLGVYHNRNCLWQKGFDSVLATKYAIAICLESESQQMATDMVDTMDATPPLKITYVEPKKVEEKKVEAVPAENAPQEELKLENEGKE